METTTVLSSDRLTTTIAILLLRATTATPTISRTPTARAREPLMLLQVGPHQDCIQNQQSQVTPLPTAVLIGTPS